ncbi:MAG TPA: M15 family metallopeptidase [Candidatus Scatomorpha pullistercoris]|uniref:M15 family metallopeptidase n=1 Tax=Candidatus Scatomorpha pullistercoris TaxID=2840929 RepID=A0A9D1K7K3_9FIRM|nr:M15 family metallopeptidase [Candidatus Scatomorpha pullistercoris]
MKRLMLFLVVVVMVLLMGMGAAELSGRLHGDKAVERAYAASTQSITQTSVLELPAPVKEQDWKLRIVSEAQPLPEDFTVETEEAENCYLFDARAAQALRDFLAAGRAAGMDLEVASAWRDWATQETLFEDKVNRVMSETGLEREQAEEIAADEVARPGTSEHQLGLAVDIISNDYPWLDEGWADTAEAAWLEEHCAEYGFILRYPPDKSELTGIIWEPWHFRYVGKEAAVYIMENGLCLEEYAAGLS